jgi:hypothetical protein
MSFEFERVSLYAAVAEPGSGLAGGQPLGAASPPSSADHALQRCRDGATDGQRVHDEEAVFRQLGLPGRTELRR